MPRAPWSQRTWRRVAVAALGLAVVATVLCAALIGAALRGDRAISVRNGTATAEVISTSFSRTLIRFATPDGEVHSPHEGVMYPGGLTVGDRVRIEYDTNNPDIAKVAGRGASLTYLPVGTAVLLTWAVLLPAAWYARRRAATAQPVPA